VPIGSFEVFLNYNVNSSNLLSGVLPAGQEVTWSVSVQNVHFLVTSGETYSVLVEAFLIGAGHITANIWGSTEVLATPGG
jgi:predicted transporter